MTFIEGKSGRWEYTIGLEVHAQIKSNSKLFSTASTVFGAAPNSQVELLDAAMPGVLPILNEFCVHQAIKTALGLNAKINLISVFDRKNYFYVDLPLGYQISQFYHPIAQNGWIEILDENDNSKKIGIIQLHIEQDAGKTIHDKSEKYSYVDLNRSGIALMEIVLAPDLSSPEQAVECVKKLRAILRYLDSCDGDMEKGSLRCDANVSVRKPNAPLGIRCEVKNLNSTKSILKAIEFEGQRQVAVLESGGQLTQETRLFDVATGETRLMRYKEDSKDYRYFPDPDLSQITLNQELIDSIAVSLPELPDAKTKRYVNEIGLSSYDAVVLVADKDIASFFEEVISYGADPKLAANWLSSELFGLMNKSDTAIRQCNIGSKEFSDLINLISTNVISSKIAKIILKEMFDTGESAERIMQAKNLQQISDPQQIAVVVDEVLKENHESVVQYKAGKNKLFSFFVGQIMKKTAGNANPVLVNEMLTRKLSSV